MATSRDYDGWNNRLTGKGISKNCATAARERRASVAPGRLARHSSWTPRGLRAEQDDRRCKADTRPAGYRLDSTLRSRASTRQVRFQLGERSCSRWTGSEPPWVGGPEGHTAQASGPSRPKPDTRSPPAPSHARFSSLLPPASVSSAPRVATSRCRLAQCSFVAQRTPYSECNSRAGRARAGPQRLSGDASHSSATSETPIAAKGSRDPPSRARRTASPRCRRHIERHTCKCCMLGTPTCQAGRSPGHASVCLRPRKRRRVRVKGNH